MNQKQLLLTIAMLVGLGPIQSCSSNEGTPQPGSVGTGADAQAAGDAGKDAATPAPTTLTGAASTDADPDASPANTTAHSASPSVGTSAMDVYPPIDGGLQGGDTGALTSDVGIDNPVGEVITGENSQVVVPPGAGVGNIAITIEQGTDIADESEWTYQAVGDPIQLGPSGTIFSEPVHVTLSYSPEFVGDRPDLLVVAHRDDLTGIVTFIHPDSLDGSDVNVSTTSFSTFQPVMYTELMSGVVRDRGNNAPIEGAQVFFYGSGYGTATTDANGMYSFTIEQLSSFGGALSGTLYIGADGYFETSPVAVTDLGAQASLPVVNDVTLLASAPLVTGVVTDGSDGSPLAGVTVAFNRTPMSTFRGGATTVSVTTANDGSYALDASFFSESGVGDFGANLMVNASGFLGASASVSSLVGPVTQDFSLNSSAGNLMTGVVRDRGSNAPIEGAQIFFYGSGYGTTTSDANGEYAFTIEQLSSFGGALSGTLYVGADGYFEAPSIAVSDLSTQGSLPVVNDVTLLASAPLVTGIVTDNSDGSPVAGATVSFNRTPMSTFRGGATTVSVTTANDGSYAIDASYFAESVSGEFSANLMVNALGFLGATASAAFQVGAVTRDFALNSSSGELMIGVVRDRGNNAPVAGAKVFFYGSGYGTAMTDANGAYVFTVAQLTSFGGALSGTLYVGADGYFEAPSIAVTDLGTQAALPVVNDVTLLASAPLISGVITDSNTGTPLAGVTVSFNRSPMSTFRGGATTESVTTANDGSYAIDASYFAENVSGDFTANLMANLTGFLGATRSTSFGPGPVVEDLELTPGTSQ